MKKTLGILVALGGGYLLLKTISANTRFYPTGCKTPPKIVYMLIGENTNNGILIKIEWSDGITTEEYYSETEAEEIIKIAQEDGAIIDESEYNSSYDPEINIYD